MPEEKRLTGVSMYRSMPAKSMISSSLEVISFLVMPMMEPFMYMFSLAVISGWKPVPTSSSEAMRPR